MQAQPTANTDLGTLGGHTHCHASLRSEATLYAELPQHANTPTALLLCPCIPCAMQGAYAEAVGPSHNTGALAAVLAGEFHSHMLKTVAEDIQDGGYLLHKLHHMKVRGSHMPFWHADLHLYAQKISKQVHDATRWHGAHDFVCLLCTGLAFYESTYELFLLFK
jgi:hypothetical protein